MQSDCNYSKKEDTAPKVVEKYASRVVSRMGNAHWSTYLTHIVSIRHGAVQWVSGPSWRLLMYRFIPRKGHASPTTRRLGKPLLTFSIMRRKKTETGWNKYPSAVSDLSCPSRSNVFRSQKQQLFLVKRGNFERKSLRYLFGTTVCSFILDFRCIALVL